MSKESRVNFDSYDDTFRRGDGNRGGVQFGGYALSTHYYESNAMAKRIIDIIPDEVVSPGFRVDGVKDEDEIRSAWDALDADSHIIEAMVEERLTGGSAIVALINDGKNMIKPAEPGPGKLEGLRVFTKDSVSVHSFDTNPMSVRYGKPELYRINSGVVGSQYFIIHHSRVHIFKGERVSIETRKLNNGWGGVVLTSHLIDAICDWDTANEYATKLLRRKQQGVWKVKGLDMLCDDDSGRAVARKRLAQVDDNGGVTGTIGIDADMEEYNVLNSDVGGVVDVVNSKIDRLSALTGIHEIVLRNKNTGGVSASQNTALETYYKMIDRIRNAKYKPVLEWLLPFIVKEDVWSVEFEPLSMPSAKEQAETLKLNIESLDAMLSGQALDVEEVRSSLESLSPLFKLHEGLPKQELTGEGDGLEDGNETTDITPGEVNSGRIAGK